MSPSLGRFHHIVVQTALGSGRHQLWSSTDIDAPTLSSLSSSNPYPGDSLTVSGTGFGTAGSPADFDYTAPSTSSLVPKGPGPIFFDRIMVSFTGSTSDAMAGSSLDAAVTAITPLLGYSQVGFSPDTNTWQVELSWDTLATVSDWDDLCDYLIADANVDDAIVEAPVWANATGFGPGQDVATSWQGVKSYYAAYDMIGIEEAWRLFAATSPTLTPYSPEVVVIDSGLLPASPAGAANGSEPRWDAGTDRGAATIGVSGILGGLQQWGVDDDGDGTVDGATVPTCPD
ncbi:MAG: hypothetical protein GXP62_10680, partial [Oligoflexia bacterium]|nr:hypothetical protein [Oligoflexia bacterium]